MSNRYINIGIWFGVFLGSGYTAYQLIMKTRRYQNYTILFEEPLGGLYVGSEVFLNGIRVGSVQSLDMWTDDLDKSLVVVKTHSLKQREYIRAEVALRGVTGHSSINMRYVKEPVNLEPINGIEQIQANQSFLNRIRVKLESIATDKSLDELVQSLTKSIEGAKATVEDVRNIFAKTQALLDKVDSVASTVPASVNRLNQALDSTNNFIRNLDKLVSDSHLPVLLNQDLKTLTYSQTDLRRIVRDLRDVVGSIKHRPMQFLSKGASITESEV